MRSRTSSGGMTHHDRVDDHRGDESDEQAAVGRAPGEHPAHGRPVQAPAAQRVVAAEPLNVM